jgi:drug/metabolite transporter (DMT)-like permease
MEDADVWQINFYRSVALIGAITVILVFQYRQSAVSYVLRIGRPGLIGGAILAASNIFFLYAFTYTTIANALFIMSAIPFITAGLARIFLKERLQRTTVITMFVAAMGIIIMIAEGVGIGSAFGNVMALSTAICFSSFAVIIRRYRGVDMLPTLLVSGLLTALIGLLVRAGDLAIPLNDILLCFLWGGLLSGFANWAFIVATRHLFAAEVTLFMLLETALGPVWVWLFVDETPTWGALVGGILVIASVAVLATDELRHTDRTLRRGRPSQF